MSTIVYLNGEFIEQSQAKVSVYDRGFLFGDSVYEVIPVYQSKPFRLSAHIERLHHSLKAIKLSLPYSEQQWDALINDVITKNNGGNQSLYIQITRGCEAIRDHVGQAKTQPTILITSSPLDVSIGELTPIKVTLLPDIRWQNCFIKTTSLLGNIMLKQQAAQAGFDEAILHRDLVITEGTTTNVFLVKNNIIYTPIKNQYILAGITRDVIIELASNAKISIVEQTLSVNDILQADEVWLSSSSREISPVTHIDDKIVAQSKIGPVTKKMHQLFQAFKQELSGL